MEVGKLEYKFTISITGTEAVTNLIMCTTTDFVGKAVRKLTMAFTNFRKSNCKMDAVAVIH